MESDSLSPKISDVAHAAGVSIATVSRVIHNSGAVSEETRTRVQEVVEHLGYQSRRSPKKPTSEKTVLLLSGDVVNPFFAEIIRGMQEEANLQGSVLNIIQISTDHEQLIRAAGRLSATGVVLTGASPFPELLAWREENNIPLVVINYRINQPRISCITVDFRDAYARATRHLTNLGHTRIGYVDVNGSSEISQARLQGHMDALTEADIPFHKELYTSIPAETHVYGGFRAASNLLALPPIEHPTAILAFNDLFALGIMHAAQAHGLRVPEDISVVGCDDIPMAAHANPPLTTIGQPKYRIGKLAVSTLLQMCEDSPGQMGSFTLMESPLIIRESTSLCHTD
ncbi:MAG: LacI family DNA-binding transcriptional regulator [Anaerolineae bacterium]|nr:LacI family DNA-binding transcriptional regulator [Anaerolineae bacterium]